MNSKSKLNIYCQKSHKDVPCYTTEKKGDTFVSIVTVGEASFHSINAHSTKKEAENDAACIAIQAIVQNHPTNVKNIDELIEKLPASKNKKKSRPDTQQPHEPVPAFTAPMCAVTQLPVATVSAVRPLRPHHPPAIGDPRVQSRTFHQPGEFSPPQQLTGANLPTYLPPQLPQQPPPHPLYNGQIPIATMPRQPFTMPSRPPPPLSVSTPGAPPVCIPPPPGYVMSPSSTGFSSGLQKVPQTPPSGPRLLNLHVGKPLTAIPSPIRPQLMGPPHGLQPQVISTSNSPSSRMNTNATVIKQPLRSPNKTLEDYCTKHSLPPPIYKMREESGKFSSKVEVGNEKFSTEHDFSSFVAAKESVATVALTSLGIQAMNIGSPSLSTPEASSSAHHQGTPNSSSNVAVVLPTTLLPRDKTPPHSELKSTSEITSTPSDSGLKSPAFFLCPVKAPSTVPLQQAQFTNSKVLTSPDTTTTIVGKGMEGNYKASLNTYCQKNQLDVSYECSYPEDSVGYIASVSIGGMTFTSAPHGTKRAAESQAAEQAVKYLGAYRDMNRQISPLPVAVSTPATQSAGHAPAGTSFKNLLQEHCQKYKVNLPHYETERTEDGFVSTVRVHQSAGSAVEYTSAAQPAKKAAEQEAAKLACEGLSIV